jgi:hypothetical protein
MFIAAVTVGATIAGLILYLERKSKQLSYSENDEQLLLPKQPVEPLPIQSIP